MIWYRGRWNSFSSVFNGRPLLFQDPRQTTHPLAYDLVSHHTMPLPMQNFTIERRTTLSEWLLLRHIYASKEL